MTGKTFRSLHSGARSGWVAAVWFLLAGLSLSPAATPPFGDITFFVASDLHYGYDDGTNNCANISRGVISRMNALPGLSYPSSIGGGTVAAPRGVLLIGDLTEHSASVDWTALTNDWGLKGERLLSFPVYEGYGNHDCYSTAVWNGIKSRNASRIGVTNTSPNGYHYSWDWDFLHVVCLNLFPGDTINLNHINQDPKYALQFLTNDLARCVGNSGRPVIIYHHYGFDNGSTNWWTGQQRTNYIHAISNYNVIGVLAGHNHAVDFIKLLGVDSANDGTAGKYAGNFLVAHVTRTTYSLVERKATGAWGSSFKKTITTFNPAYDNDGDGIPSGWENQYALDPFNPADALQDIDRDGANNLAEYIAGTNPRNAGDRFTVTPVRTGADPGLAIQVSGRAGRAYTLERSADLAAPAWSVAGGAVVAPLNTTITLTDTNPPAGTAYYRVRVAVVP